MLQQPHFGRRLRELRLERGLSQATLAGEEMSAGYLSRLEGGARPPTPRIVAYLARKLKVPLDSFEPAKAPPLARVMLEVTSGPRPTATAELLADAIKAADDRDPDLRWQAIWLLAEMLGSQGRYPEQSEQLVDLVQLSDALDEPRLQVRARTQLARCMRARGDNAGAGRYAREAVHLADAHQVAVPDRAAALLVLVSAEAEAGLLTDAREHTDILLGLCDSETGGSLRVQALWAAATVRGRQGDSLTALSLLNDALAALEARDDVPLWIRLHLAFASLCLQQQQPDTIHAKRRLETVAPILNVLGTPLQRQEFRALQAQVAFFDDDLATARAYAEEVLAGAPALAFRDFVRVTMLLNRILILQGEKADGIRNLQDLARQVQESHNVDLASEIWRTLAETLASVTDR
ncbi:helix-turn-helix domain-containing protein [Hamadaea tsunoensis]|uniref:helix-turn-helix domain-containing protein n=1 Tax=Hamadaea tsunoensis TaxID=53368 RepID=UPI0003FFB909|nr:helix-turn-helix transcriptional regulator [Hamadaea tsunoensis]